MKINIGNYQITSDSLQFIVNKIGIVQEGIKTKAENIGNETLKPIAYCGKFGEAIRYIPQDILKTNEDINIIMDKLNAIQSDIQALTEYPVIFIKEEPKVIIVSDEEMEELENE